MEYNTNCVNSTAKLIDNMIDKSVEITAPELSKIIGKPLIDIQMKIGYGDWMSIDDDWAVRFYKSTYDGKNCVYILWSAIEWIYTD